MLGTIPIYGKLDARGQTIDNYFDNGWNHFDPRYYGMRPGTSFDNTSAFNVMMEDWYYTSVDTRKGGIIKWTAHNWRMDGPVFIPHDGHLTSPSSPPLIMLGTGGSKNGRMLSLAQEGTVFILNYDGTDGLHNAKFNIYSTMGGLIQDIQFVTGGSDDHTFIFNSYGTIDFNRLSFQGRSVRNANRAVDFPQADCIRFGYSGVDGKFGLDANGHGKHMNFQGYGSSVRNCFGHKIRSIVVLGNDCNACYFENNTTSRSCGSNDLYYGAIYRLDAGDRHGASGNVFIGGTLELRGYPYAISMGNPVKTPADYQPLGYKGTQETQTATSDYTVTSWAAIDDTDYSYDPIATTTQGILLNIGSSSDINTNITITLPACSGNAGKVIRMKRIVGGTGTVTPTPAGSDTLTYAPSSTSNLQAGLLSTQGGELTLKVNSSGTGWVQSHVGTAEAQTCTTSYTVKPWITCDAIFLEVGKDKYGGSAVDINSNITITMPACSGNAGKMVRMKRIDPGTGDVSIVGAGSDTITYLDATDTNLQGNTLNNQSRELALKVNDAGTGWVQIDAGTGAYKFNITMGLGVYDEADSRVIISPDYNGNVDPRGSGLPTFEARGFAYHNHNSVNNKHKVSFMSGLLATYTQDSPALGNFSGVYGLLSGEGYQANECETLGPYFPDYKFNPVHLQNIQTRVITTKTRIAAKGNNLDIDTGISKAINIFASSIVFKTGDGVGTEKARFVVSPTNGFQITGGVTFNDNFEYKTVSSTITSVSTTTTSHTIDWSDHVNQKITLAHSPVALSFTAPAGPCTLRLIIAQDSTGSRTVTFPATCKFPSGLAPTLSTAGNAVDIFSIFYDGTNYNMAAINDFKVL